MRKRQAGVTLLEVLIAVTLLSLLSVGMMMSMRMGIAALFKTNSRLMENRRVVGAQRIVEQELLGLIPSVVPCRSENGGPGPNLPLFQGSSNRLVFVSGFSLQQAWRGRPQVLEIFVIPGAERGVRLVVNELPYTGPLSAGLLCQGMAPDPVTAANMPRFASAGANPRSFVLADLLSYCRILYLMPALNPSDPGTWVTSWGKPGWPAAIRIEMAPMEPTAASLQPITVTVPVYLHRAPDVHYVD